MHDDELWQVFAENGEPIIGSGAQDKDFVENPYLVMGNAHVWIWRKTEEGIELLLQKRSMTKPTSPGMYHTSAAGHINLGETALRAASRETQEELGLAIDTDHLYLVHVTRVQRRRESLLSVYTYQLENDEPLTFSDGDVEFFKWVALADFRRMIEDPAKYSLIDQGRAYFLPLIETIEWQAG